MTRLIESVPTCYWCNSVAKPSRPPIPETFCWTKMQAEAGQELDAILRRKELERATSSGSFYWGIGTSISNSGIQDLLSRVTRPRVVFSVMKTQPKRVDRSPDGVLLWSAYLDPFDSVRPLPDYTVLLSRATTPTGAKTRHYALVCHSESELLGRSPVGAMDLSHFRNLSGEQIGSSQVTAIIEHTVASIEGRTNSYEVGLVAELAKPFIVRLTRPIRLVTALLSWMQDVMPTIGTADWLYFAKELRRRAAQSAGGSGPSGSSPE